MAVSAERVSSRQPDAELIAPLSVAGEGSDPGAASATGSLTLAPTQAAAGQSFGQSVSMYAHTALVGAPGAARAYVLEDQRGSDLVESAMLTPSTGLPDFGSAVSMWGETAAVAAPGLGSGLAGAVVIFERDEHGWLEQLHLQPADSAPGDGFGSALHVSGNTLIVGAPGASGSGAAYIFTRTLNGWVQAARLAPSSGQAGADFGAAVAVWRDTAIVGAPRDRPRAAPTGAAYVFTRGAGAAAPWTESAVLAPGHAGSRDFGAAVALYGDAAVIGAPGSAPAGAAFVFERQSGAFTERARLQPDLHSVDFGAAVVMLGDAALVGSGARAGQPRSAYLYNRSSAGWSQVDRRDSPDPGGGDAFATTLALTTTSMLIGAGQDSSPGAQAGVVHAYPRTDFAALSADLTCPDADTLGALASCIHGQMPVKNSDGFVVPTAIEQADWRAVVAAMLQGDCTMPLPPSLAGAMQLSEFLDLENHKAYCLLMEITDGDSDGYVDKGWGTFVVDNLATRELSQQAPHPYNDFRTAIQAINIFKGTDSRTYLMCGAHRHANSVDSACDDDYEEADCAHSKDNMYYPTVLEIDSYYGATEHTQIQWHGMAYTTCPDLNVYISHGMSSAPPAWSNVNTLMDNSLLHHPTWAVDVPGDGTCPLSATGNTEGRYLNGVYEPDVCSKRATATTNKFVHVEQERPFRYASEWLGPVGDTWPAADPGDPGDPPPPPAPPAPQILSVIAGSGFVLLDWSPSEDADSYTLWRSTTSGSGYSAVAPGMTGLSYTDLDVIDGTTYYYVVTAMNVHGESGYSNQVAATPGF